MYEDKILDEKAVKAQDALSTFVNSGSREEDDFIEKLKRDHRTLQQNQVRLFLKVIEAFAETPERFTDLRNEASVKISKELIEAFKKNHDGFKPSQFLPNI